MKIKIQALVMKQYCDRADILAEFNPEHTNALSFDIPEGANVLSINVTREKDD